jgi:hypothetical protein
MQLLWLSLFLTPLMVGCAGDGDKATAPPGSGPFGDGNTLQGGDGTTPQEGVNYNDGEKIFLAQYGLTFVIPTDWAGSFEDGMFSLANQEMGSAAFVTAIRISKADLKNAFKERLDLGGGIYMVPEGSLSESADVFSSSYDITGEQDGSSWKGYVAATVGDFDWTSISIGLAPVGQKDAMVSATETINSSITLEAPYEGADFTGDWEQALAGHTFTYYYSASDYSDKETYTLCSDGSASYYSRTYSGGITGSMSVSDSGEGTWEVDYAQPNSVDVYFQLTNNNSGTVEFSVDADGKFYLGDSRYYREENGC